MERQTMATTMSKKLSSSRTNSLTGMYLSPKFPSGRKYLKKQTSLSMIWPSPRSSKPKSFFQELVKSEDDNLTAEARVQNVINTINQAKHEPSSSQTKTSRSKQESRKASTANSSSTPIGCDNKDKSFSSKGGSDTSSGSSRERRRKTKRSSDLRRQKTQPPKTLQESDYKKKADSSSISISMTTHSNHANSKTRAGRRGDHQRRRRRSCSVGAASPLRMSASTLRLSASTLDLLSVSSEAANYMVSRRSSTGTTQPKVELQQQQKNRQKMLSPKSSPAAMFRWSQAPLLSGGDSIQSQHSRDSVADLLRFATCLNPSLESHSDKPQPVAVKVLKSGNTKATTPKQMRKRSIGFSSEDTEPHTTTTTFIKPQPTPTTACWECKECQRGDNESFFKFCCGCGAKKSRTVECIALYRSLVITPL